MRLNSFAPLRRWPWARIGIGLGGLLVGSYLLYVALATAFLSFGGLAWATMDAENVHIENASGYSLVPGRLNVRGLRVRVKDYNAQMEVLADSAEMSVVLRQLPFMMLHLRWIHAHGAEHRLA